MNRKTVLTLALVASVTLLSATDVSAHRYSSRTDGHWLRVVAYPINALGKGIENIVFRPIHKFVSQPDIDIYAGHQVRLGEEDTYYEFLHPDYTPSIKIELEKYEEMTRRSSDN